MNPLQCVLFLAFLCLISFSDRFECNVSLKAETVKGCPAIEMDQTYAQGKNNGLNFSKKKKQFCLVPSRISEYPIFTEIGTAINLASRFKTVLEDKILGDK